MSDSTDEHHNRFAVLVAIETREAIDQGIHKGMGLLGSKLDTLALKADSLGAA